MLIAIHHELHHSMTSSRYDEPVHRFTQHTAAVKAIAWSPHQHGLLASGGGTADQKIRFWNTLTSQPLQCIDTKSQASLKRLKTRFCCPPCLRRHRCSATRITKVTGLYKGDRLSCARLKREMESSLPLTHRSLVIVGVFH